MSREWCVVVEPIEDATSQERLVVDLALNMREPPFDVDDDGRRHLVFVDEPHEPKRVVKAVMHVLAESDAVELVVTPLRVGRWSEDDDRYVFADGLDLEGQAEKLPPAVAPDEITWAVEACPASVFDWRAVREELNGRRRQVLRETDRMLEVAARDEADATALASELEKLSIVGSATCKSLGRFRRWQIREQLLGNYGGEEPHD